MIQKLMRANPYRGLSKEIYVLFITRIVNCMGSFIFPLLTLILTKKIGMTGTEAGFLISIGGILNILSSIIGGKITDVFGRKKIIIICTSLAAACYIVPALFDVSIKMVPFLFAASVFYGIAGPAQGAMVADLTTPQNRDEAYSLFYLGMNVGFAVSPIVGGILFEHYLRFLFIMDAATSFVCIILIILYIPETIGKTKEKLSPERKLEESVEGSIISVLKERPVLLFFALVMFGYNFIYSQWGFLYPLHMEKLFAGHGAKIYGGLMSLNAVEVIILTPFLTKFSKTSGNLKNIILGGIFYTLGFGLIPGFSNKLSWFYVGAFVLTLGEIVISISSSSFIANHTPASHRGRMNSVLPIIIQLGDTLGPTIVGIMLGYMSINVTWRFLGVVMAVFTVFSFFLWKYDMKSKKVCS